MLNVFIKYLRAAAFALALEPPGPPNASKTKKQKSQKFKMGKCVVVFHCHLPSQVENVFIANVYS